jgi:hypothetical protein
MDSWTCPAEPAYLELRTNHGADVVGVGRVLACPVACLAYPIRLTIMISAYDDGIGNGALIAVIMRKNQVARAA